MGHFTRAAFGLFVLKWAGVCEGFSAPAYYFGDG